MRRSASGTGLGSRVYRGRERPWGHCFCHVTFLYLSFPLCKTDLLLNKCEWLSAMRTCQAPWPCLSVRSSADMFTFDSSHQPSPGEFRPFQRRATIMTTQQQQRCHYLLVTHSPCAGTLHAPPHLVLHRPSEAHGNSPILQMRQLRLQAH